AMSPTTAFDLWMVPIDSGDRALHAGTATPFLRTLFFEVYPSFPRDVRWIAYSSNESGTWEVYVRRFPVADGAAVQASRGGGRIPKWSPDGRSLLYSDDDHRVMVTRYTTRNTAITFDTPRAWSPVHLADTGVL